MKKAIYINCWLDPWLEVAKTLIEESNISPAIWIGYSSEDGSDKVIPKEFPSSLYLDNLELWKGRFPEEINKRASSCYLNVDFLKRYADQELQAIKMMDRVDPDRHSFNFMERQRHFRNMIKRWEAVIILYDIDMVISTEIPHRFYDYVLFLLCKDKGIPYIMLNHTHFAGRYLVFKGDFHSIGNSFISDWHRFERDPNVVRNVPVDILTYFEKLKRDYQEAAPQWARGKVNTVHYTSFFQKLIVFLKKILLGKSNILRFFSNKPSNGIGDFSFVKKRGMKYEESYYTYFQTVNQFLKRERYLSNLLNYYESLTTDPDPDEKYVCFFMHYQPEATTSPAGDIFVDQRLCVELLLKNLPPEYKIYVKEHRHQFLANRPGQTSRMKDMYDDFLTNDRVKLISTTIDPFELMRNSQAVATIIGTTGWEAMVRKKPVIIFGVIWYENYTKGVLRVTDEASAQRMSKFIEEYEYDEQSLLAYLASFGQHTKCACFFRGDDREEIGQTTDESASILAKSIIEKLEE